MQNDKTGKVKWFDNKKGFGFITRDDNGSDLFIHHSGIPGRGFKTLNQGDEVSFRIGAGEKGPKAINVQVTKESPLTK